MEFLFLTIYLVLEVLSVITFPSLIIWFQYYNVEQSERNAVVSEGAISEA
jgi:hypothetical protein